MINAIPFRQAVAQLKCLKAQYGAEANATLYDVVELAARHYKIPFAFVVAIASRETNCLNKLGDYRIPKASELGVKVPHGIGLMRVDIQHSIAQDQYKNGDWRHQPDILINFAVGSIIRANADSLDSFKFKLSGDERLKIIASAYNCGITAAIAAYRIHDDSDVPTTNHNYGADVIERVALFTKALKGNL